MAEKTIKTVVELEQLGLYDGLLKSWVGNKINETTVAKLETVAFDEATNTINFYTIGQPVGETAPAFSVTLPAANFAEINDKVVELEEKVNKNVEDIATLKTDLENVYTKSETDEAIAVGVANASHLKREIVEALPEVAEADKDTIYMLAVEDKYEDYMLINGELRKIGDSTVDLTNYTTKDEVANAVSELENGKVAENATAIADVAEQLATIQYASEEDIRNLFVEAE